MKIGTRPDAFYTEDGSRTITSDVPTDFTIKINNMTYHLHKSPILSKCGLLQRLLSKSPQDVNHTISMELHDTPGGEEAFEACAKFCYEMTVTVSAHNFVPIFCAAKFLRMTATFEKGNLVPKLEAFFASCILRGWKDSILALQTTSGLAEWPENLGVVKRCVNSVVEKILSPPTVSIGRGKTRCREGSTPPTDWWMEDLSTLDEDLFRRVLTKLRSSGVILSHVIGEALHVYATRWLLDKTCTRRFPLRKLHAVFETIVSLIPPEAGSVSLGFLLRLLSAANHLGGSEAAKAEILRRSAELLPEAAVNNLLPRVPEKGETGEVELVVEVLESFFKCRRGEEERDEWVRRMEKVGRLIDGYIEVLARDCGGFTVEKMVFLASAVPEIGRPVHDGLYHAVNTFLKVHPELSKAEKKKLCRILDCRKLSPEARAHAVRNERLPLRTVVQVLYIEQEKGARATSRAHKVAVADGVDRLNSTV